MAAILLVEDNGDHALLIQRLFQNKGIRNGVDVVKTGNEAMLYVYQNPLPCLILLDLGLPDIHGLKVLDFIRSREQEDIRKLCVFILTMSDDQDTIARSVAATANAFLSKNLDNETFMAEFLLAADQCGAGLEF